MVRKPKKKQSKHINWTLGLKCYHRVWPWPWPWPWIFKFKYRICFFSAKNGPIATKQVANISIELQASNKAIRCDLDHDLDLEFSRSNMEFPISQTKVVWMPRNEKQTFWLNSKASNVAIRFDLGRDLDLGFSRWNMEFHIFQPKVVRLPWNKNQTYQLNSRPQMWPMGLTLTITLTFEL